VHESQPSLLGTLMLLVQKNVVPDHGGNITVKCCCYCSLLGAPCVLLPNHFALCSVQRCILEVLLPSPNNTDAVAERR
jgi:hypothetical protein